MFLRKVTFLAKLLSAPDHVAAHSARHRLNGYFGSPQSEAGRFVVTAWASRLDGRAELCSLTGKGGKQQDKLFRGLLTPNLKRQLISLRQAVRACL